MFPIRAVSFRLLVPYVELCVWFRQFRIFEISYKVAGTLSDTSLQLENINNGSGIKRFIFDKCIHEWS